MRLGNAFLKSNAGPDAAANATLADAIPANTTFASLAHPGTWSCSVPAVGATGSIFCSNPSLAASASDVFTLAVTVDPVAAGGTVITDSATVATTTADPAPGNDTASSRATLAPHECPTTSGRRSRVARITATASAVVRSNP